MSRLSTDIESNDIVVKHNIPHRFEKTNTIGIAWCCHCGKMVPVNKGGHLRCTECELCSHDNCAAFVPDLCGLPKSLLNELRTFDTGLPKSGTEKKLAESNSTASIQSLVNIPGTHDSTSSMQSLTNVPMSNDSNFAKTNRSSLFPDKQDKTRLRKAETTSALYPSRYEIKASTEPENRYFKSSRRGVGLEDFTFLAVLGKGNFGKVMLAQEHHTNTLYGIKVLKKEFILEHDEVARYF
jgi:classical protein kinase C/novel protein kinase C epsilon type